MKPASADSPRARILSVTALAGLIQGTLEADFGGVWVVGEISGLRVAPSGHMYFTLKDARSQLRAVMFRGHARLLRFRPEDGLQVLIKGRVNLYTVRGDLQVYAVSMEPRGLGEQQLALEQLKAKLAAEGLFAAERKRPLPFFPRRVGVVTALKGAAVHDVLTLLHERCPHTRVVVRPAKVQGAGAGLDIAAGVNDLNEHGQVEVIIVGRGGGSREDLAAFNDEVVVRAIAGSLVPVVAAVGHEIDVSLADLVADSRAPTPSAAAEMVVPTWADLAARVADDARALSAALRRGLAERRAHVVGLRGRIRDPHYRIDALRDRLCMTAGRLGSAMQHVTVAARGQVKDTATTLNSLSPLAVLGRGYSLTRTLPDNRLVRDAATLHPADLVRLTFARGEARARIEHVETARE